MVALCINEIISLGSRSPTIVIPCVTGESSVRIYCRKSINSLPPNLLFRLVRGFSLRFYPDRSFGILSTNFLQRESAFSTALPNSKSIEVESERGYDLKHFSRFSVVSRLLWIFRNNDIKNLILIVKVAENNQLLEGLYNSRKAFSIYIELNSILSCLDKKSNSVSISNRYQTACPPGALIWETVV